jgi:hypothetical protein
LASEAAVGANKPVVGKGGREAERPADGAVPAACFDDGVFGRGPGVADGVRDLAAWLAVLERGSVDGALRVPAPFDGVRGVGVLERAARMAAAEAEAVAVGGRVPGEDVDFEGDAGVLADLGGAVDGRDVEADARGLIAGVAAGMGAGAGAGAGDGVGASCTMMGPSPSAVDGIVLGTVAEGSDVGGSGVGSR